MRKNGEAATEGLKERQDAPARALRSFWRRCDRHPQFASILKDILDGKTAGRILLVATSELFSTVVSQGPPFPQVFRSKGLPYLSHRSIAVKKGIEEVASYQAAAMHQRHDTTVRLIKGVQETTGEEFRDQLVIAILKTIQKHPGLRELVTSQEIITKTTLRQIVKDYSEVEGKEFEELLAFIPGFLLRPKQKKALNRLTLDLDPLVSSIEPDYLRRWIAGKTITRFLELLRKRRVSESNWGNLLIQLINDELVMPSIPLYLWCRRCPGVGFTVSSLPLDCSLPPFCPSCGRIAQAISTYAPSGLLREAMELTDGLLGAAIGWSLFSRKLAPNPALTLGGTECDFIFPSGSNQEATLLECKMHHVLSPLENIRKKLLESRNQLRNHIVIARDHGMRLKRAACVVNLSAAQLESAMKGVPRERDEEFSRVGARVISYEHLLRWLDTRH